MTLLEPLLILKTHIKDNTILVSGPEVVRLKRRMKQVPYGTCVVEIFDAETGEKITTFTAVPTLSDGGVIIYVPPSKVFLDPQRTYKVVIY